MHARKEKISMPKKNVPRQESNPQSSDSKRDVLPVTPWTFRLVDELRESNGNASRTRKIPLSRSASDPPPSPVCHVTLTICHAPHGTHPPVSRVTSFTDAPLPKRLVFYHFCSDFVRYYLNEDKDWGVSSADLQTALDKAKAKGITAKALAVINPGILWFYRKECAPIVSPCCAS